MIEGRISDGNGSFERRWGDGRFYREVLLSMLRKF